MIEKTQPVTRPSESVLLVDDDQDLGDMFQLGLVRKAIALGALEWVVKAGISPRQLAGRVRTWLDAAYRPDARRRFGSSPSRDATITSDIQASHSA